MPTAKTRPLTARDILDPSHPLNKPLAAWVRGREAQTVKGHVVEGSNADPDALTVRKARKFLTAYPQFKAIMVPVTEAA